MRFARVIADPGRDEDAASAGLLFITPFATAWRRSVDRVDILTDRFSPPELIDAELETLAQRKWPQRIETPEGYNIAGSFEFASEDRDSELILLDIRDVPILSPVTALASVRSRIIAFPWPGLEGYLPRPAARVRALWQTAVVALEHVMDGVGIDRASRSDVSVEYSFSDVRGRGAAGFAMVLEGADPLAPYIRLESRWFTPEDGEEPGPTIRYPIEWMGNDVPRLVTDNGSAVDDFEAMGATLADWWVDKLPGGRPAVR